MKRLLGGVLAACLLSLALSVQAQGANWTIIYYSAADTDLESFMIGDLMEMQIVGSSDDVNIVVEMDRVEGYDETNGRWTDARRFLIARGDESAASSGDFQMDREGYLDALESLDAEEVGLTQSELDDFIDYVKDASDQEFEALYLEEGAPLAGKARPQGLQQVSIESIGEPSMGDPDHLAEFATWAIESYPAEHYMLILSNHGGGWAGVAFDDSAGGDPLTLPDLDQALGQILDNTGLDKLDLVAFDACLMGQLEVYNTLAPYALYTIAAEEPIPGAGWEYVTPLQALVDRPSMDIPEFGEILIDSYMDYYTNVLTGYPTYDLHLVDLSKIDEVNDALNIFISFIREDPSAYIEALGYARAEAQGFSQDDPDAAAYFSSVDLSDFMEKVKGYSESNDINESADDVIRAIEDAVVYSAASEELSGAQGLAIYFPANADDYSLADNNQNYPEQAGRIMVPWISFLDLFHGTAENVYAPAKTGLSIDITHVIPSDYSASIYEPPTIIFDTDGTGVVDMQFYASLLVDGGLHVIVDAAALESSEYTEDGEQLPPYSEGPTTHQFPWSVESPVVEDAAGNAELITLISNKDNPDVASVSGIYRTQDGDESEAYIIFDIGTRTMQSVYGIQESLVGQALGEIKVRDGDTFEPYYLVLNDDGTIERVPSDTQLVFGDTPFTYNYYAAPTGDYLLTIWLEDIAGNIVQDSVEFSIDNEGLDEAWRGIKDIDSGISFLYPWSWGAATSTVYEDGSYKINLSNEDSTQYIEVGLFSIDQGVESLEDVEATVEDYLADYGAELGESLPVIAGYEGYELDAIIVPYTYVSGSDVDRMGWLIMVYVEDNGLGYRIDIDIPQSEESTGQLMLTYILATLYIEPPAVLD